MNINKIMVASDFTSVSDNAIEHALILAKASNAEVFVLHVARELAEVNTAKIKLAKQISDRNPGATKTHVVVKIGNFITEIGKAASEEGAQLIMMGTHGPRGVIQTVTGGDAMKVVSHSEKPFIVVQEKGIKETGYDDIVVPLDMTEDSKQKLDEVADIAKYFNSKVHIIAKHETDGSLYTKLKNNVIFAKKYFLEKGVDLNIVITEPKTDFEKEIIKYAKENDADLIAIINSLKWNIFGSLFASRREEQIITNKEQIPVLCVNPVDVKSGYSM
ncbi:MAG: universal stress protein [Flavobacteriales bacterium]|jgi:nucleotide-binding universal stress UspA family protein